VIVRTLEGTAVTAAEQAASPTDSAGLPELLPRGPVQAWPIHALARVIDWALVAAAAVMIVLVFFNVCSHALGRDLSETTEACEFLMVWVSFLGGASLVRRSGHMTITEFIDKLDGRARLVADFVVQSVALGALWILFRNGLTIVGDNWGNVLTVLQIPMAWQYMPLSVGSGAAMIFVAYDLCQILCGKSREERYGADE
jgi:TRAP-type transport system small permease protein